MVFSLNHDIAAVLRAGEVTRSPRPRVNGFHFDKRLFELLKRLLADTAKRRLDRDGGFCQQTPQVTFRDGCEAPEEPPPLVLSEGCGTSLGEILA